MEYGIDVVKALLKRLLYQNVLRLCLVGGLDLREWI